MRAYVRVRYARMRACVRVSVCMRVGARDAARRRQRGRKAKRDRERRRVPSLSGCGRESIALVPAVRLLPHRCLTRSSSVSSLVLRLFLRAASYVPPRLRRADGSPSHHREANRPPARPRSISRAFYFDYEETPLDTRKRDRQPLRLRDTVPGLLWDPRILAFPSISLGTHFPLAEKPSRFL